jgi:predicted nucleotidyltransferase
VKPKVEWKEASMSEKALLAECKATILRLFPTATVILYGSHARNEATPDSDYDLLVLLNEDFTREKEEKIWDTIYDIELKHEIIISVLVHSRENWGHPLYQASPLHKNIDQDGIVL